MRWLATLNAGVRTPTAHEDALATREKCPNDSILELIFGLSEFRETQLGSM
jgi:hypothetical protein